MSSSKILHKRNSLSGAVPATSSLYVGELAINTADGKLFIKTTGNEIKHFSSDSETPYIIDTSLSSIRPSHGSNDITGAISTIINGIENDISGAGSVILNGENNSLSADYSFIGGGTNNKATGAADFGAIIAGQNNFLQHQNSFIIGSNISSHAENFTYVQNLSVIGDLFVGGSSLNGGGGGGSSNWESITNKPTTLSGYGITDAAPISLNTFVTSSSANWEGTTTTVNSNSANWGNVYTNVNSNSANWNSTRTTVNSNSAKWENTYTAVNSNSASWSNISTNVNTNSAKWENAYTNVNSNSANWGNVYTNVNSNSANWNSTRTTVNSNSGKWENTYTNVNSNSGTYATKSYVHTNFLPLTGGLVSNGLSAENFTTLSTLDVVGYGTIEDIATLYVKASAVGVNTEQPNKALTVVGDISATGDIYGGSAESWNNTRTIVSTNSGNWDNSYTTVNSNSANWNSTRTTVNSNSAKWENVYTNVNSNSANWNSTRTTVNSNSAKWENVYTNVNSNSSTWSGVATTVNTNSANWSNVYTNVNSNSSTWSGVATTIISNSANWNSVYTSYSGASSSYASINLVETNFLALTGGTITGNVTATKFYGDGSELTGIVAGDTEATTLVRNNSADWDGVYTTYSEASSSYSTKEYVHTNFLPLTGGVLTNLTVVSSISATDTLYGNNLEIGNPAGNSTVFVASTAVGINTEDPQTTLDINGDSIRITNSKTPSASDAIGIQGEMCWDSSYFYICVSANTWKRISLSSW
jgi:hypothetical protein